MLWQVLVLVWICAATIAVQVDDSALTAFNEWLASGSSSTASTARASIVRLRNEEGAASPLRLELHHTDVSLDSFPIVSLPLHSHVLGMVFLRSRPYNDLLTDLPGEGVEKQLQMLTVAMMTEIALWDLSPIRPWCQFLLKEPKSIGISTPPILWPRELAEELEPKFVLDAVKHRRTQLESFVTSRKGNTILMSLETFVNKSLASRGEARSTFSMRSTRNYLRVRAIVETSVIWTAPGGLLCVPFANFIETIASSDQNVVDRYLQQTLKEPVVRRLRSSVAVVAADIWSFYPQSRDVRMLQDTPNLRPIVVEVEASNVFAVDEYFGTFGRLPTRVPWTTLDCQLIVFSNGLSRERNKVKGTIAVMLDDFLHHFSCIRQNGVAAHGLVAAIISVLPSNTPGSFAACVQSAVKQHPPVDDVAMEGLYQAMLACLNSAKWKKEEDLQTVMSGHKAALRDAVSSFGITQFRRERTLESDETLLFKLSAEISNAKGSSVERHAAVDLRYHRKLILHQLIQSLEEPERFADAGDTVEL
jgi:hypothetical protein